MMYGKLELYWLKIAGLISTIPRLTIKNGLQTLKIVQRIIDPCYGPAIFINKKFDRFILFFIYRDNTNLVPRYGRITKNNKELKLSIELNSEIMTWCDDHDLVLMKEIFTIATCEAVLHALRKHKLPTEPVENLRSKLGEIPTTIAECEQRSKELKDHNPFDDIEVALPNQD